MLLHFACVVNVKNKAPLCLLEREVIQRSQEMCKANFPTGGKKLVTNGYKMKREYKSPIRTNQVRENNAAVCRKRKGEKMQKAKMVVWNGDYLSF